MNIDVLGKFYLGNGGIGDALIFLSTFYDDVKEANVIFLANEPDHITNFLSLFPKIKKKLVLHNDFEKLREFYYHPNCIGTGIIPKDLDYRTWNKIDIFKEYGVKEFPEFVKLFQGIHLTQKKQLFIQKQGSAVEGVGKKRILDEETLKEIAHEFPDYDIIYSDIANNFQYLFQLIAGSDLVIGVDSFCKTFSAMCKVPTIVYDNIYDQWYLKGFPSGVDAGHYVFLFPWSQIQLRQQPRYPNHEHQKEWLLFKVFDQPINESST